MSFEVITHTLGAAVNDDATFTVGYPAGRDAGHFIAYGHEIVTQGYGKLALGASGFTVSFDAAVITITNTTGGVLPAGLDMWIQLNTIGGDLDDAFASPTKMSGLEAVYVNLGAPDTADADGVSASQAITAAGTGIINGALASGGVATFDVPRNVVAAWTNTAIMTVTGEDEYGNTVVESSTSGTSLAGKKAFKRVTAVDVSADVTGATVGTGDVLGLPVFLPSAAHVLKEVEGGAVASSGTVVAGVRTAASATTGDVRGTYDPNSAANGARQFGLFVLLDNAGDKGAAQFAG